MERSARIRHLLNRSIAMARTKSNEMTIKSLEEADRILQEMC